jgi:hypothetical protein
LNLNLPFGDSTRTGASVFAFSGSLNLLWNLGLIYCPFGSHLSYSPLSEGGGGNEDEFLAALGFVSGGLLRSPANSKRSLQHHSCR